MNPTREEAIFALALTKPAVERAAWLDRECADDPALRQRLEASLAAHDKPESSAVPAAKATIKLDLTEAEDESVGKTIGRYKVLEKVGEGGCGVVYVAEQTEPVRRRVALKVIKLGMDTKQVVARFEAERQALAMMDHPNIAKVLDAGATESGRPFFVMELVRGIKITEYCDQANLTTTERLDLFIKVCRAIQHAHQKGIIHRDIKPSNILVTMHDGVPVPKVIDFGIAKATVGQTLTDKTVYTQLQQFIGTPAYMSPEQAEMSGLDIDTRSDIYSLGVLLYELLAGSTPFDAGELMSEGIDAMRKTIREMEPVRPSTRLATLKGEELTTTAKRRSVDTARLLHQLKGDLDWIVMKCLEKDRTRRYETANGLAADLKRHLNNEPVVARPPSAAYRFQKAFRRNKMAFTAGAAVMAAVVLGLGVSTALYIQEHKARIRADEAERIQAGLRADAEKGRELIKEKLANAELGNKYSEISFLLSEEKFEKAASLFKELPPSPNAVPFYGAFGRINAEMGQWSEAFANFSKVIEYEPSNAIGYLEIARVYANREEWPAARTNLTRAIQLAPSDQEAYYELGPVLLQTGDKDAYEKLREKVLGQFGGTSDPAIAERTAKEFLMVPPPASDLAVISKLAETCLAAGPQNVYWVFFEQTKGLAEYRQGHFADAVDWTQKVLDGRHKTPFLDVDAYAVLAMAHHQLKHFDQAHAALASGTSIAETNMPQFGSHNLGGDWKDVIIARVLLREAQSLVEGHADAGVKTR